MSTTITIGADVRHWITFEVKDVTPEELAILERGDDDPEALALLREMRDADRFGWFEERSDDYADHFSAEGNPSIVEVEYEDEVPDVRPFDGDLLRAIGFESRPGRIDPAKTAYDLPGTGWSIYDASDDTGGLYPWGYEHENDGEDYGQVATINEALREIYRNMEEKP